MLKFFRRIRQSLLAENKFRKYLLYALGEILLVVIGILIALQINNWNEERKEQKLGVVVLHDIQDNILRNNVLIQEAIHTIDSINFSANAIRIYLISDDRPDSEFYDHIGEAVRSGTFLFRLNSDGYESLKSTGFAILGNEKLKDQILNLFEVTYGMVLTDLNFANSIYLSDVGWWKDYLYKTDMTNKMVPYDLQRIKSDKRFLTEINDIFLVRTVFQNTLKQSLSQSEQVLRLIEVELENK